MITAGPEDPIYFTNLIYDNQLYTYTFKWPELQPPFLPPQEPCNSLFKLSRKDLNAFFATAQFVEPEILEGNKITM